MGTRSRRLTSLSWQQTFDQIPGRFAHVVLFSGATHRGKITHADAEGLVLQDPNAAWYNLRRHTHRFELSDIREVIWDEIHHW